MLGQALVISDLGWARDLPAEGPVSACVCNSCALGRHCDLWAPLSSWRSSKPQLLRFTPSPAAH